MMIGDKVGSSILPLQDANQYTCLHYAAEAPNDNVELVKYLAELGGMELVAQTDLARQTCLHCAAFHGNLQVVEYLTDLGESQKLDPKPSYTVKVVHLIPRLKSCDPKILT
jgi:ankyrin repeat protein